MTMYPYALASFLTDLGGFGFRLAYARHTPHARPARLLVAGSPLLGWREQLGRRQHTHICSGGGVVARRFVRLSIVASKPRWANYNTAGLQFVSLFSCFRLCALQGGSRGAARPVCPFAAGAENLTFSRASSGTEQVTRAALDTPVGRPAILLFPTVHQVSGGRDD